MCARYLLIILLSIISIVISILIFMKNKEDKQKNDKDTISDYDPFTNVGIWVSNNNQSLIIDDSYRSVYQNKSFSDSGRYVPNLSNIFFQRQGQQNLSNSSSSSIKLTETFRRNTLSTPCINKATSNYVDCLETAEDNNVICEGGCDGTNPTCLANCNSSDRSARLDCKNTLRVSCPSCNGIITDAPPSLYGDYQCSPNPKGASVVGNWTSSVNDGQLINIYSDNTVEYLMFDGSKDSGKYDGSNKLLLVNQGIKTIEYNPTIDTITVSVTMNTTPPSHFIYGSWSSNDNGGNTLMTINNDNTVLYTSTIGNRNYTGKYDPSSGKVCFNGWDCDYNQDSSLWLSQVILSQDDINIITMTNTMGASSQFARI